MGQVVVSFSRVSQASRLDLLSYSIFIYLNVVDAIVSKIVCDTPSNKFLPEKRPVFCRFLASTPGLNHGVVSRLIKKWRAISTQLGLYGHDSMNSRFTLIISPDLHHVPYIHYYRAFFGRHIHPTITRRVSLQSPMTVSYTHLTLPTILLV